MANDRANRFGQRGRYGGGQVPRENGTIAKQPAPSAEQGTAERRAEVGTRFTKIGGTITVYEGDRNWVKVTVTLETAGPVSVGTAAQLEPVIGGVGVLLKVDRPYSINISKGSKLYMASTSVNRVQVTVEPLPWLEQVTGSIRVVADRLTAIFNAIVGTK